MAIVDDILAPRDFWIVDCPGIALCSPNRLRGEHPRRAAARVRKVRYEVEWKLLAHPGLTRPALPLRVHVVRYSAGVLDAHDNLPASCKPLVDAVAWYLGVEDNDQRVIWSYGQEKCRRWSRGARIEIRSIEEA